MFNFIKKIFGKEAKSIKEIEAMFEEQYNLGYKPISSTMQPTVNHVYQIVSKVMEEDKNIEIPEKVWAFFKANATDEHQLDFNKPIKNQISEHTINLLVFFYRAYIK